MNPKSLRNVALLGISLVGILTSAYLLYVHHQVSQGSAASGLCNINQNLNCASAAASRYAKLGNFPIAGFGLAFYLMAFILSFSAHDPGHRKILRVGYASAVLISVPLAYISFTELDALCPGCLALYAVNLLGLFAALKLAKKSPLNSKQRQKSWLIAGTLGPAALLLSPLSWLPTSPKAPQAAVLVEDTTRLSADYAPSLGPEDAAITIVEFSDFQCPFCARLSASLKKLQKNYPDLLRIEFRHLPLAMHAAAEPAARGARCAQEQDAFWAFHDRLFEIGRGLSLPVIEGVVTELNLDVQSWKSCFEAARTEQNISQDREAAMKLSIRSTPTFFINGQKQEGAKPYDELEELLKKTYGELNL